MRGNTLTITVPLQEQVTQIIAGEKTKTTTEQTVGNVSYIAESIVDPDHDEDGDVNG